jgi:serine/threonine-protein kinase
MATRKHVPFRIVSRYAVFDPIAKGGMASVCFGRLMGPSGFTRTVVVKRPHPELVKDPEFAAMFLDEARIASRVAHPNVVSVIDIIEERGEILLVMEYVHGEALSFLAKAEPLRDPTHVRLFMNVVAGALTGLHAAHETRAEDGKPLGIVHRDVSPENILIGVDGVPRMVDFGIAKASNQAHRTAVGFVKGKMRYLSPEQAQGHAADRRTDIWAAAVVLWELLTKQRLFSGESTLETLMQVLEKPIPSPRELAPELSSPVAAAIMRGLERDRDKRYPTALAMAEALEAAVGLASARETGAWVAEVAQNRLAARRHVLDEIEAENLTGAYVPNVVTQSPSPRGVITLEPVATSSTPMAPLSFVKTPLGPPPVSSLTHPGASGSWVSRTALTASVILLSALGGATAVTKMGHFTNAGTAPGASAALAAQAPPTPSATTASVASPSALDAVSLDIHVNPPGARVFLDDVLLSAGSFEGKVRKSDELHRIRAEKESFAPMEETATFDRDQRVAFSLERMPHPTPRSVADGPRPRSRAQALTDAGTTSYSRAIGGAERVVGR